MSNPDLATIDGVLHGLAHSLPNPLEDGEGRESEATQYEVNNLARAHVAAPPEAQYSAHYLSQVTGIDPQTIRRTLATREFQDAVDALASVAIDRQVKSVHKTLYLRALAGSAPHIKIFLERFDKKDESGPAEFSPSVMIEYLCVKAKLTPGQAAKLLAGKAAVVVEQE